MSEVGGRRSQRLTRDAAGYGNLDVSTVVPGVLVPDQSDGAISDRAVADLMGSWFRYDPRLVGKHRCSQGCRLGGLAERCDQE